MKKGNRRPARKAAKPKRKATARDSREGVRRGKSKRALKAKARKPRKTSRPKNGVTTMRRRRRGEADMSVEEPLDARGLGAESAGQSGDTEGLSRAEQDGPESVGELVEEGQAFEAGVISGVENAPDADKGGVRTRQVPEDDVPQEYLDED